MILLPRKCDLVSMKALDQIAELCKTRKTIDETISM